MLSLRVFSRNIICCTNAPVQKFHTTFHLANRKDDSSSSSSSDSDSDDEKKKATSNVKKDFKSTEVDDNLNQLLNKMILKLKTSKTIDVSKSKDSRVLNVIKTRQEERAENDPFDKKFRKAATKVAESLGGDVEGIKTELLYPKGEAIVNDKKKTKKAEETPPDSETNKNIMNLLMEMDIKQSTSDQKDDPIEQARAERARRYSRIEKFSPDKATHRRFEKFSLFARTEAQIFDSLYETNEEEPKLKTWDLLNEREINLCLVHPPDNYFEEQIQWTEKGILWKFPIDNEQGMHSEDKIHFSEHVFMERHLQDWCPKKGPIRHFMELVCVGLSKNAFLTVEEKIEHIAWYRNYFAEKEDLLKDIGALPAGHVFSLAKTDEKKQINSK